MSQIDNRINNFLSRYSFLGYLSVMLLIFVVFAVAVTCIGEYVVPKRQSTGVVIMRTQTADRYGTPEYYLYIRDDSTGITIEKDVSGSMYAYCPKGKKLSYVVYNEFTIHNIKLIWKNSSESLP